MEILGIPVIISIVYGLVEVLKITFKSEKFLNFIPLIASVTGAILGVISFYLVPEIVPATNVLTAFLFGFFSGLSATGSNQIVKQLSKIQTAKKLSKINEEKENAKTDETEETKEI